MPTNGSQARHCVIKGDGGDVVVRLQANNTLQTGGEFLLRPAAGTPVRARFTLATGSAGVAQMAVSTTAIPVASLDHNRLAWEILACALHPAAESGVVEVLVLQDGVSCAMTKPARWDLSDVPSCAGGTAVPIHASLTFLLA